MPTVLTERETQVLTLAASGRTSSQMGSHLGLSAWTVKSHMRSAFRKLGAADRAQAVAVAYQRGLLPMPPGSTPIVLAPPLKPIPTRSVYPRPISRAATR